MKNCLLFRDGSLSWRVKHRQRVHIHAVESALELVSFLPKNDVLELSKQLRIVVRVSKEMQKVQGGCFFRSKASWHSKAINQFLRPKRGHMFYKPLARIDHLVTSSYVGACIQNLRRVCFYRWKKGSQKIRRGLLVSAKLSVLRQPQTCYCSCESTGACI